MAKFLDLKFFNTIFIFLSISQVTAKEGRFLDEEKYDNYITIFARPFLISIVFVFVSVTLFYQYPDQAGQRGEWFTQLKIVKLFRKFSTDLITFSSFLVAFYSSGRIRKIKESN